MSLKSPFLVKRATRCEPEPDGSAPLRYDWLCHSNQEVDKREREEGERKRERERKSGPSREKLFLWRLLVAGHQR